MRDMLENKLLEKLRRNREALAEIFLIHTTPSPDAPPTSQKREKMAALWEEIEGLPSTNEEERADVAGKARQLLMLAQEWLDTKNQNFFNRNRTKEVESHRERAKTKLSDLMGAAFYEAELTAMGDIKAFTEDIQRLCVDIDMAINDGDPSELRQDEGIVGKIERLLQTVEDEPNIANLEQYNDLLGKPVYQILVQMIKSSDDGEDAVALTAEHVSALSDAEASSLDLLESLDTDLDMLESSGNSVNMEVIEDLKERLLRTVDHDSIEDNPLLKEKFDSLNRRISALSEANLYPEESDVYKYLTGASRDVLDQLWAIKNGGDPAIINFYGDEDNHKYAADNNLSHIDVAAIKIYTNEDFRYINASSQEEMLQNKDSEYGGWIDGMIQGRDLTATSVKWENLVKAVKNFAKLEARINDLSKPSPDAALTESSLDQEVRKIQDEMAIIHASIQDNQPAEVPNAEPPTPSDNALEAAEIELRQKMDAGLASLSVRVAELRSARQAGNLHAKQVMQALRKMNRSSATLYRGEALTEDQFNERYTRTMTIHGVRSSTTVERTAGSFAFQNRSKSKNHCVVAEFRTKTCVNIAPLSEATGEAERIILPGTTFRRTSKRRDGTEEVRVTTEEGLTETYTVKKYKLIYTEI